MRLTEGFFAHRGLIMFAVAVDVAEAGVLAVSAPVSLPLAPQATALAPLAVFHDLRWLYSLPRPWPDFVPVLAGLILVRSAAIAVMVRLGWPSGVHPPPLLVALRTALGFTLFACLLMSPVVSLAYGVAILPFSWPYLAVLPIMLAVAIPLSHGAVARTWWRSLPPLAAVGWLMVDFVVLSAAAAVVGRLPVGGAVAMTGLTGLVNARAWYGIVSAAARPRHAGATSVALARPVPVVLIATGIVIAVVIAVTRVAFVVSIGASPSRPVPSAGASTAPPQAPVPSGPDQAGPVPTATPRSARPPVLVVAGFGSTCCTHARALARSLPGTEVRQFSYLGLDAAGAPLPYGPAASNLPLPVLGDRIARQVEWLHDRTGQPVSVVAESEGTLGVDAMLARHPGIPVRAVALLSPIVAPDQAGDWSLGAPRTVPAAELSAVVWFVGGLSPYGTSGAQTLITSVDRQGARYAAEAARHPPDRMLEVIPLADAVTLPACSLSRDVVVVNALHGQLLSNPWALRTVSNFLNERTVRAPSRLRKAAELVAATARAWRMPASAAPSPPCLP